MVSAIFPLGMTLDCFLLPPSRPLSPPQAASQAMALMLSAPAAPLPSSRLRETSCLTIASKRRSNSLWSISFLPLGGRRCALVCLAFAGGHAALGLPDDMDVLARPRQSDRLSDHGEALARRLVRVRHEHGHRGRVG